jgi:hypothetical protein
MLLRRHQKTDSSETSSPVREALAANRSVSEQLRAHVTQLRDVPLPTTPTPVFGLPTTVRLRAHLRQHACDCAECRDLLRALDAASAA